VFLAASAAVTRGFDRVDRRREISFDATEAPCC